MIGSSLFYLVLLTIIFTYYIMTKYNTSREMMEAMNNGDIPRQHLGPKNFYILKQELFSLKNEYNPETFTEEELTKWNGTLAARMEEIEQLSDSEKEELLKEVDKMLDPTS